jgi:hypothetical protein
MSDTSDYGYTVDSNGERIAEDTNIYTTTPADTSGNTTSANGSSGFSLSDLKNIFNGTSSAGTMGQLAAMGGVGALLANLFGGSGGSSSGASGYQGGIPTLTASRQMLPIPTTMTNASGQTVARRPGSGGITYFTPIQYSGGSAATPAATATPVETTIQPQPMPFVDSYAAGGIANLGGYSDGGQLLRGPGDGVSDDIPATIGNRQPARLADGEFVVPARIVSELGNGSTEAGARKLYAMMDRIKATRAKAKNIAANTKADKHLPA